MQPILIGVCCNFHVIIFSGHFARTLWEDLVHFVVFANMSFLWRGAWNLNAMYMIEDPLIGGWVNHIIGTVLLTSLQILQIVGACGCAIDGSDEVKSTGGIYHTEYLRKLLQSSTKQNDVTPPVESHIYT